MQTLDAVLATLRNTLLAACGVGVSGCTSPGRQPAEPEHETKFSGVFTEQEPGRETPTTSGLCVNPQPILGTTGQPNGYVRCADGAINRESELACAQPIIEPACKGTEDDRECDTAAQCTDHPHGFCMSGESHMGMGTYCSCVYPCLSDADCAPDHVCICPGIEDGGTRVASCAPATCKTNSDCASGECGVTVHHNGCHYTESLHCRTSNDACRSDAACETKSCAALGDGSEASVFNCEGHTCAIGRPLTVDDGVRVAELSSRRWGVARLDGLSSAPGRAEHWLAVARMEHASVASFARFVHELLRFGAPPRLLADAIAAAADEVRHAEQTFAIASAYAGAPVGPGALQVDDLEPTDDPELFVTRLITEGCVGETLGVAEALALLDGDLDPQLRPQLEQIAADEARHAALAWRTLRWFAPRVDPAVIDRAFDRAIEAAQRVDDEVADPTHGRLGRDVKRRLHALAVASVIEPCRRSSNRRHGENIVADTRHLHA